MKTKKHQIATLITELNGMQEQLIELGDAYIACDDEVKTLFSGACRHSLADLSTTFAMAIKELKEEANKPQDVKIYKLWDNVEKSLLNNQTFHGIEQAEKAKDNFLEAGNYYDRPHTVISIQEFVNGKFVKEII